MRATSRTGNNTNSKRDNKSFSNFDDDKKNDAATRRMMQRQEEESRAATSVARPRVAYGTTWQLNQTAART